MKKVLASRGTIVTISKQLEWDKTSEDFRKIIKKDLVSL